MINRSTETIAPAGITRISPVFFFGGIGNVRNDRLRPTILGHQVADRNAL